jgi:hypothetical protein
MACFLGVFGRAINAETRPSADLLSVSIMLLLLDSGLDALQNETDRAAAHYLIGFGFEQTGALLARFGMAEEADVSSPLDNDHWYRLTLAFLHYLAGGYRVQALSALRQLIRLGRLQAAKDNHEYRFAAEALRQLYLGAQTPPRRGVNLVWRQLIFGDQAPDDSSARRIHRLVRSIRARRAVILRDLGQGSETNWLAARQITDARAVDFWRDYLQSLRNRDITTFTEEQRGPEPGFDRWLRPDRDLLVILPTGSGKTIVGELRAALTLTALGHAIWIAPTRALVRQIRKELRRAFEPLDVSVEELPTTEDFIPLDIEASRKLRHVAITTPEKLLALIRSNPQAVGRVGLIIVDEAQILLKERRGATVEFVLQQMRQLVPTCRYVLMTGFRDVESVLRGLLERLRGSTNEISTLVSDIRPTRRIYGIVTNDVTPNSIALIYPPGVQQETGTTTEPFEVVPRRVRLSSQAGALEIARRFLGAVTPADIRSVLFVNQNRSTETQAAELANANRAAPARLPTNDTARLRVELGRRSIIESTAVKAVAPHHAGLTALEQHLVEKWVHEELVRTVVATPTLAEGVNLPFDLSVVSFTQRFSTESGSQPVPVTEIQNMLGRAGRAGYVSDGICLLALQSPRPRPVHVLDQARPYFFRSTRQTDEYAGLSRLVSVALGVPISDPDWLEDLGGADFGEIQQLIAFVVDAVQDQTDKYEVLFRRLSAFPSVSGLLGIDIGQVTNRLTQLAVNLEHAASDSNGSLDPMLMEVLKRTGMPVSILKRYISALREAPNLHTWSEEDQIKWSDQVVFEAFEEAQSRNWYASLITGDDLPSLFGAIQRWRSGLPIGKIEAHWRLHSNDNMSRIAIGRFLNHRLSLLAQFWGALAVCDELVNAGLGQPQDAIKRSQTYVREGVSSVIQLEWLRALGGIDRVLAHVLADAVPLNDNDDPKKSIRDQLKAWHLDRGSIPGALTRLQRNALVGLLDEAFKR